ncbi:histone H2B.6-like [Triticum urartu]|uniref:histone H2B.6-like n=1 Tax=Triticum urartu TaxID=4572 RepID=UPI002043C9A0|nr:histone H2B.6-like [Triticum urartu]
MAPKAAEKEPAAEKVAEKKPAEKEPAAEKAAEKKPAEKEPAAEKAAGKKPAEKEPAAEKAAEKKPAEKDPATEKAAEKPPATAGKKPVAEKRLPAGETSSKAGGGKKWDQKEGKRRKETYRVHIYRVLKEVHGKEVGITSKAMAAMNSFVNDMFERLAAEAGKLARYNKKSTIGPREIRTSVRFLLPGSLSTIAFEHGDAAVDNFKNYKAFYVSSEEE